MVSRSSCHRLVGRVISDVRRHGVERRLKIAELSLLAQRK